MSVDDQWDSTSYRIKRLIESHTTGPGDDKGLAEVEDLVNWVFVSAGAPPPRRIILRWQPDGNCMMDFADE